MQKQTYHEFIVKQVRDNFIVKLKTQNQITY